MRYRRHGTEGGAFRVGSCSKACHAFRFSFFFFFFLEEEALHVSLICHRSNIRGQLKETSGMKAYTARPTTGEAALPWQAIRM